MQGIGIVWVYMVYTHSQTLEHIRLLNQVLHPTTSKHYTLVQFLHAHCGTIITFFTYSTLHMSCIVHSYHPTFHVRASVSTESVLFRFQSVACITFQCAYGWQYQHTLRTGTRSTEKLFSLEPQASG